MNSNPNDIANQLIHITKQLLIDLDIAHSQREISLQDSIQDKLGIDSISRAELSTRVEKAFGIELPTQAVMEAETLADVATAIAASSPMRVGEPHPVFQHQPLDKITTDVSQANTLIDVLLIHAKATPDRPHMYLMDEKEKEETITYQQLLVKAQRVAQALIQRGLKANDMVAIMLPTQAGFFYSFIGILFAGGIPVPIYPPARAHQLEEYARKEARILTNCSARFLITFKEAKPLSRLLQPFVPSLKEVIIADDLLQAEPLATPRKVKAHDIALIQYTSGSTSHPKGVTLTHANLLSNIQSYGKALQLSSNDVCVSWAPLYHDLGLIGNWLGSLYWAVPLVVFSPLVFLTRPERWLWAIHYHRGTVSAGPNFAYELCVRKLEPAVLEGLDLSSWRVAINGAETVYPKTLERFTEKFSVYGFKPESCLPVYGLAENSLGVTCPPLNRKPVYDRIDRLQFEREHRAVPTQATDVKQSLLFTSCGLPLPDNQIRIVDEKNQLLPERVIGRIHFVSPASMQGYYNNPEATRAIYHDGWWDSGDLGYIANGELYITGRRKDVIIKAGRNLFASEIEDLTSDVPGVRRGCVIAFSVNNVEQGTDQLVIVAEITNKKAREKIREHIIEKVTATLNIAPDDVVLVAPHIIPKTSSGKLQRSTCKTLYLDKKLERKILPPWVQFIKISIKSFFTKVTNALKMTAKVFYTAYIAIIFGITILPMWLVMLLGTDYLAESLVQKWMRLMCFLSFCPRKIIGAENLTKRQPMMYVANHQSYMDVVLLSSFLPPGTRYIGKASLFKAPFLKTFLKKLKHISVEKDSSKALENMDAISNELKKGNSVFFFPEGTFSYATGLRPFKLGAFKIAAETNVPVCPIAIQGTRYVLRGNELLFKPHAVTATIGQPLLASGADLASITHLKNTVRNEILSHCGEASLDFIVADKSGNKNSEDFR